VYKNGTSSPEVLALNMASRISDLANRLKNATVADRAQLVSRAEALAWAVVFEQADKQGKMEPIVEALKTMGLPTELIEFLEDFASRHDLRRKCNGYAFPAYDLWWLALLDSSLREMPSINPGIYV
jgi:hypothetical protein